MYVVSSHGGATPVPHSIVRDALVAPHRGIAAHPSLWDGRKGGSIVSWRGFVYMGTVCRPTLLQAQTFSCLCMHDQHGGAARLAGRRRLSSARIITG